MTIDELKKEVCDICSYRETACSQEDIEDICDECFLNKLTIEPKQADDLISRADAIKAIDDKVNGSDNRLYLKDLIKDVPSAQPNIIDAYARGWTDGADAVKAMPQPKRGEWIPCSERLPSENGDYLVTLENGVVKILGYSTTQRTTYPKGFYHIKDGFSWRQVQNPVVAWMPLPQPYNGARMTERRE